MIIGIKYTVRCDFCGDITEKDIFDLGKSALEYPFSPPSIRGAYMCDECYINAKTNGLAKFKNNSLDNSSNIGD